MSNENWLLLTDEQGNINGANCLFHYDNSNTVAYLVMGKILFNKTMSRAELKNETFENVTFERSYTLVYNPAIQPNNAELTDAIFEALGVEDTGAERIIIDQNLNTFDGDLGQAHQFKVIEIGDEKILEYVINIKVTSDTLVNNLKNKKFKEFIEIRKDIQIEGTKLVPEI